MPYIVLRVCSKEFGHSAVLHAILNDSVLSEKFIEFAKKKYVVESVQFVKNVHDLNNLEREKQIQ